MKTTLIKLLVAGLGLWLLNPRSEAQPVITTQPTNQIVLNGSNVVFSVAVSGTGPFTYQWQFNGTNLSNDIITTVAGNGLEFYDGDGGPATNANLRTPTTLAFDAAGNFYIADSHNEVIRRVDTNGIITTVAGHGSSGYSGDGGPAAAATMATPVGIAVDVFGNYFISDNWNQHIRKVDTNGIISSIAGIGTGFPDGGGYSGDGGAATNAAIAWPCGVSLDTFGNLYIADSGNNVIRRVDTNGIISTVAGNTTNGFWGDGGPATSASLNNPQGVTVDSSGNLFVADTSNNRVRRIDTNGIITTIAGTGAGSFAGDGGLAINAGLSGPADVKFDGGGNLYIADSGNHRIRCVDATGIITTVVGNGNTGYTPDGESATNARFNIYGMAFDSVWNLYFATADSSSPRIYEAHFTGLPTRSLKNVNTNNAGNYWVVISNATGSVTSSVAVLTIVFPPSITSQPTNQAVYPGGDATFSVAALGSPPLNYQWLFNGDTMDGQTNSTLCLSGVSTNQAGVYSTLITSPYGNITSLVATLAVGGLPTITMQPTNQSVRAGTRVLLTAGVSGVGPLTFQWQLNGTNLPNNLMTTVAGNGIAGFSGDGGIATTGKIYSPYGLATDHSGNLFFADMSNMSGRVSCRIREVNASGVMTTVAGTGVFGYSGDGGAATNAQLRSCYGVAVDGMGNLFIADTASSRIRKVDTNGIITTVAGNSYSGFSGDGGAATHATLSFPFGIMVDTNGNLFIADTGNNRIRKVDTNGIITTVAGNSSPGFSGDGGAATNASLREPQGLAMDANGNLLIADTGNYRVRQVDIYGGITTLAGNGSATYSGDNGTATNAGMYPYTVAVDGYGDVLIADYGNNRIRQVDPYGIITTLAGTNAYGYNGDGLAATNTRLNNPAGVAMDGYGRVVIADTYNSRIRRFGQGPTLVLDAVDATNAGNYVLVVNSSFGSVTSAVANLTVLLPPTITTQPASQSSGLGSNATFSVSVTGTQPLFYLWQSNGISQSAQTNQSLNLTNVQWTDAGNYQVVVTNSYGSITSAVATLTVGVPPSIISQPSNQMVLVGSNGVMSVQVVGDGLFTYQWQFNGTNLPPIITTVAGTNIPGFVGDGGPAINAKLSFPERLATDAAGNLLINDNYNNRVRKVDTNGIITTIAGTGISGYSGNGGLATNANIYANGGLGADARGNFFIAEFNGGRICKVDTNDIITLVAGGGSSYGENLLATSAAINGAKAVAVDKTGNLFIADYYYYRVRKVGTNGLMTTVAGNPTATGIGGFSGDGGRATNATLGTPYDVTVDSLGNFYIADTSNNRIRKVDTNGIINTVIGGGVSSSDGSSGTNSLLPSPVAVGVDCYNNLYVTSNGRIRKMDTNGVMTTVAGGGNNDPGDYGPATSVRFGDPMGLAFDSQGNLYIADPSRQRIRKVHFSGDPTLELVNSSLTNSGNYSVIINSPFGSVVSGVANLTVVPRPTLQTFNLQNGQFTFTWDAVSNLTYQLQYSTNLITSNWMNLGGPITATNASASTAVSCGSDGQRFYRVQLVP
jgi:sugar lactone lactonase YvrE